MNESYMEIDVHKSLRAGQGELEERPSLRLSSTHVAKGASVRQVGPSAATSDADGSSGPFEEREASTDRDGVRSPLAAEGGRETQADDWLSEFQAQASGEVDSADFMMAHQALVSSMGRDECIRTGRAVYMPGVERACFALLVDAYRRGLSG